MKKQYVAICRKHWSIFVPRIIVALIVDVFLLSYGFGLLFNLFVDALILAKSVITYLTDYVALTETHIVGKRGFIKSVELSTPLGKVQSVSLSNGLLGKLFGSHNICIDNAGSGTTEYVFKNMSNAKAFCEAVESRLSR